MTTSTPNLGLVLYNSSTDSAEYFSNFRAVIAGTSLSSNFYKIDTAYGSMQTEIDDIQAGAYFTLASYISANYYEATVTGITAYTTGMKIILSLDTASAGTVTLNINSLGIKSIMKINSSGTPVNISSGELMVGKYYLFTYDGTRWIWVDSTSAEQIYIEGTSGNVVTVNSDNTLLGTTTQSLLVSQTINSATNKVVPIGADKIGIVDTADSNSLKSTLFSDITASDTDINTGTNNVKYITSLSLRESILNNIPDGQAINYQITSSIATNDLTVNIVGMDGSVPSSSNPILVRSGNSILSLTSPLSVTISDSYGDVFAWDAGKIQGNDAQLFVYIINNNGTLQLGLSPSPTLSTIATNYLDTGTGSQTGSAGHTNMVMSGTRNATNSCRIIGRINVLQSDANLWTTPVTSMTVNNYINETSWLTWSPNHTRVGGAYTNLPTITYSQYMVSGSVCTWSEGHTQNATPGSTGAQRFTAPISAITRMATSGWDYNVVSSFQAYVSAQNVTMYKYDGTSEVTASRAYGSFGSFIVAA